MFFCFNGRNFTTILILLNDFLKIKSFYIVRNKSANYSENKK